MKQKLFKTNIVDKLEEDILINKKYYINMKKDPDWLIKQLKDAGNNNFDITSKFDVEPFELVIGGPETDSENSKIIFSHFKDFKPFHAVSSELWTYMTHIQFPEYMANRWEIKDNENEKKLKKVIQERYFAIRGSKGIVRNGIARLWWAGYWGYDEKRENPFELVEVILARQEIYEHISERAYNRNKNILIASLEAIKERDLYNRDIVRELYGKINSYGSDKHLDALNLEEARKMVDELIKEITEKELTLE